MTQPDHTEPPHPPAAGGAPTLPASHAGAVRLHGPRFQDNPAAVYREVRRLHGQVAPVLLDGDVPAWLVLGHRELLYVVSNPALFGKDSRRWNLWDQIPPDWPLQPVVGYEPLAQAAYFTEGQVHRQRAGVITKALQEVDLLELKAQTEQIADHLIDDFCGTGEADLVSQYTYPLPLLAVSRVLGLSEEEGPGLVRDITISINGGESAIEAHGRVRAAMERLVERARKHPGPDVASRMAADPAMLSDEQIIQDLTVVTTAAHQPTADWLGTTLRLMLVDDRFADGLSRGRRSIGQALEEVLWEDTPTQIIAGRYATQDTELAGRRIRTGDMVILGFAAANSDPQIRPDGHADVQGNHAHLSYSYGEHGCPYPAREISEVIAKAAVGAVVHRIPDVRLAVSPQALVFRPSAWMRGLISLPVVFTPQMAGATPRAGIAWD